MKPYMILLNNDNQGVVWAESIREAMQKAIDNYGEKCIGLYDDENDRVVEKDSIKAEN